jgi:hypothetical protein
MCLPIQRPVVTVEAIWGQMNYLTLKRELKVWKYIFNLFHFEMLIQNRNPKFRPLCLFVLTFHEYEARFVFGFRAGPNTFTFWSANFQIKLAPLILYTTLVYTSTLKSTV